MTKKPKRILLKLSGEMLGGNGEVYDNQCLTRIAHEIADLSGSGYEVGVVIGGGNIFRGAKAMEWEMDRTSGDYMGMLATVINALALQNVLEFKFKTNSRVMTAISMQQLCEPYIRRKAMKHLEKGRVVIFAGGTGNPYFTTDTGASLRAREIEADMILKATKVDGIYDSDPATNPDAVKLTDLTYMEVISKRLQVMDATAMTMCMEAGIPIKVFKMGEEGCCQKALVDSNIGTLVK